MSTRNVSTVLGPDLVIDGNVMSQRDVHVRGVFKGTLKARTLVVENGGAIDGNVEAETVVIDGSFSGNLVARSVSLGRTGSISADITYVSMEMENGATFNGHARRTDTFEAGISDDGAAVPVLKLVQPKK